jgi:hypothetical protein
MSAKTKTFTEKQLARLPAIGYWLGSINGQYYEVVCIMNGACKYTRGPNGQWSTLLWSCAPTRKAVAENLYGETWEFFPDHASMIARHPNIGIGADVKAPNDF